MDYRIINSLQNCSENIVLSLQHEALLEHDLNMILKLCFLSSDSIVVFNESYSCISAPTRIRENCRKEQSIKRGCHCHSNDTKM